MKIVECQPGVRVYFKRSQKKGFIYKVSKKYGYFFQIHVLWENGTRTVETASSLRKNPLDLARRASRLAAAERERKAFAHLEEG